MSELITRTLRGSVPQAGRRVEEVFTPSTPVSHPDAFSGRHTAIERLTTTLRQRGQHVVIFGERGTGKTSLAQVAIASLNAPLTSVIVATDEADTFTTLWQSALTQLRGSLAMPQHATESPVSPVSLLELFRSATKDVPTAIVFDDFQNADDKIRTTMTETLQLLQAAYLPVTLVFAGVGETTAALLPATTELAAARHDITVPRMNDEERFETILRGFVQLGLTADDEVVERIAQLSLGLPRHLHALCLSIAGAAIDSGLTTLGTEQLETAVATVVEQAPTSLVEAYLHATVRARRGIYPEILVACTLTAHHPDGSFLVSDVRDTLQRMVRREVRGLTNQIGALTEAGRGSVLIKRGAGATATYRFVNPLLEPYILMRGLEPGWTTGRNPEDLPGLAAELGEVRQAA
jgi:energy-coupling factor transporter ATP-binding protein EcfA2